MICLSCFLLIVTTITRKDVLSQSELERKNKNRPDFVLLFQWSAFIKTPAVPFSQVHVKSDGVPVASSPFLIRVGDPGKVQVAHVRSEELFAERVIKNEVDLAVESSYDMNDDEFSAKVTSPNGENVPCIITRGTDNRLHVKFTPHKPGPYKVNAWLKLMV